MSCDLRFLTFNEMACKRLDPLVCKDLVEEQVSRVVRIKLHLAFELIWFCDCLREQLYQHSEIVGELWSKLLQLFHLREVKDIACVLVEEVEVRIAQQLNFD